MYDRGHLPSRPLLDMEVGELTITERELKEGWDQADGPQFQF